MNKEKSYVESEDKQKEMNSLEQGLEKKKALENQIKKEVQESTAPLLKNALNREEGKFNYKGEKLSDSELIAKAAEREKNGDIESANEIKMSRIATLLKEHPDIQLNLDDNGNIEFSFSEQESENEEYPAHIERFEGFIDSDNQSINYTGRFSEFDNTAVMELAKKSG